MKKTFKYSLCASVLVSFGLFAVPNIVQASDNVVSENAEANSVTKDVAVDQTSSDEGKSIESANDPSNTNVTNNAEETTTPTQSQASPQLLDVDGVFTVGDQLTPLTDQTGTTTSNRSVAPHTAWYTDKIATSNTGDQYYRVSTLEYINAKAGIFTSNVNDYSATATVTYKKGASVHSFTGYGENANYTGNDLASDSSWLIDKRANKNGKYWYEIGNNLWIPQDYVVVNNAPDMKAAAWVSGVPLIAQRPELPNGCEITAVTMMLQYAGANVDKMQLAQEMPRSSDPNYGYIGQPWDSTGITIFPNALMSLVEKYAGTAKDLTGQDFNAIKYQIDIGHPVVTWNTLHGFPYHALTVTGYDSQYVYYNDCWTNQSTKMEINAFIQNWNTQNRRAISY